MASTLIPSFGMSETLLKQALWLGVTPAQPTNPPLLWTSFGDYYLKLTQALKAELRSVRLLRLERSDVLSSRRKNSIDRDIEGAQEAIDSLEKASINAFSAQEECSTGSLKALAPPALVDIAMKKLRSADRGLVQVENLLLYRRVARARYPRARTRVSTKLRNSTSTMSTISIPAPPYALSLHRQPF